MVYSYFLIKNNKLFLVILLFLILFLIYHILKLKIKSSRENYISVSKKIIDNKDDVFYIRNFLSKNEHKLIINYTRNHHKNINIKNHGFRLNMPLNNKKIYNIFYSKEKIKRIETIVQQNTNIHLLKPNFPIEYRYYPKGSSGMKTHSDTILFTPPQYEVVYTIQNSSDSHTGWYSKDNKLTRIHTEPNSAIIIKAGSNRHYVSPVTVGVRSILKLIYSEIRTPIKKYS